MLLSSFSLTPCSLINFDWSSLTLASYMCCHALKMVSNVRGNLCPKSDEEDFSASLPCMETSILTANRIKPALDSRKLSS